MGEKLLRLPKVVEQVGLGKTKIYALIKEGEFPKPIKMGIISVWQESEVQARIAEQVQKYKKAV